MERRSRSSGSFGVRRVRRSDDSAFGAFEREPPERPERSPALLAFVAVVICLAPGCARNPGPDAYGNVEATEVVVASEIGGQLLSLAVEEGQTLGAGAVVGSVESAQLTLERDQLAAQRDATASRVTEVAKQVEGLDAQRQALEAQRDAATAQRAALKTQLEIAQRIRDRTERLFAQQAATSQQRDQAERDVRVLDDQLKAQDDQIRAQTQQVAAQAAQIGAAQAQGETARRQVTAADAQIARVSDRVRRAEIRNPSAGTVLVTYARPGEMVQPGQPLYKIANLDAVDVRAYVTEPQLSSVRLGGQARVSFDAASAGGSSSGSSDADARQTIVGTITWVSSEAEFTPTPIQTRDERADLVYATKIRVPNTDGRLKIGMPVDVQFGPAGSGQAGSP